MEGLPRIPSLKPGGQRESPLWLLEQWEWHAGGCLSESLTLSFTDRTHRGRGEAVFEVLGDNRPGIWVGCLVASASWSVMVVGGRLGTTVWGRHHSMSSTPEPEHRLGFYMSCTPKLGEWGFSVAPQEVSLFLAPSRSSHLWWEPMIMIPRIYLGKSVFIQIKG